VETTLARLLDLPGAAQFLVVAGKNESLRAKLERVAARSRGRVRVFGFVTNIQDHMEASDVAVTKAGGLTVSECLARGLPLIVFNPIPGQEEMNADWLVEYGAAVKVRHAELLPFKLGQLLGDGQRLGTMKRAARRLGRPEATAGILGDLPGRTSGRPARPVAAH
jgi:processive 1,2-diacylglycerol beta-glucosyltransferase